MVNIKKRSGESQKFDRNKLKNSVKKAGAENWNAESATVNIEKRVVEGTSTGEIREWVYEELRSIPSGRIAAENYYSYKKQKRVAPM